MFIRLECKYEIISLEKLQARMNREHIDKLVKKAHKCLGQFHKCYWHCKKGGYKVHEIFYCTGSHSNAIINKNPPTTKTAPITELNQTQKKFSPSQSQHSL